MYVYCYPIKKQSIINYLKPGNPGDIFNIVANIHFASAFRAPTAYLEILRDRRGTFDPSKRSRKQFERLKYLQKHNGLQPFELMIALMLSRMPSSLLLPTRMALPSWMCWFQIEDTQQLYSCKAKYLS